jgi:uncharacterized membrane protein YphA (DoxX/SURF4 family)
MSDMKKMAMKINLILLGLVMLIPGLLKLFVMKPTAIVGMLGELGFPTASFLAWVLILSEIIFGALILAKYKLNYTVWPPIIILVVASFTAHWGNWPNVLVHLALASNFWVWGTKKA